MADKKYATRDEIEQAHDRDFEDVPAPELGENVWLRVQTMTADDRDRWEKLYDDAALEGRRLESSHLLVRCLVDPESGKRLYQDDETSLVGSKGHHWQTRAVAVAVRLNALRKDSIETLAKN